MNEVQTNDLRGRAKPTEVRFGVTGKIIGAVIVLALAGAVGTYAYKTMPAKQAVPASDLPAAPSSGR